ncbi:energy-coupling factor ABC transporter ATP-binding protein [Rhodobacteraceae bacterium 10Alg 79]|uniref:Energy-coupling factor ABC transporter ATP-binding protein n=2 Tax=Rhodalgimonas zhirmunskyi TaxID=2964767 RepID=A0AAJ1X388_9RHOB|nr:energy-coupling factor ABC transporter ATP-binding protein [Rhodoalgimonas zhirmunskyi]
MSVTLEGRPVLDALSLDLSFHRLGVVGRNGSGKSTLARLIAGLIAPDSGTIRLNGADLARDRRAALREVGILFQNPDHQIIFPTVIEEVAFGLAQLGQGKRAATDAARDTLARFSKQIWADTPIAALSQGQKHLVCLMAIVAMNPRCLILDEPFAGLDIPTKAQLRRYLALYPGAVIHISHDPTDLEDSDQLLWLEKGRIAAQGPHTEVNTAYLSEMHQQGERDDISDLPG